MTIDPAQLNAANAYANTARNGQVAGITARDEPDVAFGELVASKIEKAIEIQKKSEKVSADAVLGQASLIDVMEATNNAEATLNLVLAIRDRALQAYEKILQLPI